MIVGVTNLPVPPLAQTLERYLATVRPLLDEAGYAAAQRARDHG